MVGGYIVGILVAAIVIFLIVKYLILLRLWATEKKMGKTGKFSNRSSVRMTDEEAEHGHALYDIGAK